MKNGGKNKSVAFIILVSVLYIYSFFAFCPVSQFLSFFFNISNLTTHIQREWSHIYDAVVVDNNWITPLLR